ncbi:hypothetical protein HGA34_04185 [Candidatus Falkowbacteria bacterium]|nr:hypothetical protein [Candidatus Falkowbacteria bacterium]
MDMQNAEDQEILDVTEELSQMDTDEPAPAEDSQLTLNQNKVDIIRKLLSNIKESSEQLLKLLDNGSVSTEQLDLLATSIRATSQEAEDGNVIEGVFDGVNMIGPDGHEYHVSANYASKSKLVEGDRLKLVITKNGTFLYKQIGPIERTRLVGQLRRSGENDFLAIVDGKTWRLLNASITYFKGDDGDEVVILVPKDGESRWAAVENIIKK